MPASDSPSNENPPPPSLRREIGIFGATMMGLGSIVGTGIFVSIGNAAGSAGSAVVVAIAVAAVVAAFNGLSKAPTGCCPSGQRRNLRIRLWDRTPAGSSSRMPAAPPLLASQSGTEA